MSELTLDAKIRRLRYMFFKQPAYERLAMLFAKGMISEAMLEIIPQEFFVEGFDRLLHSGSAESAFRELEYGEVEASDDFQESSHEEELTASDIIEIINKEIQWCEKHGDTSVRIPGLTPDFQETFIKGLSQAKNLIILARSNINDER